MNYYALYKPAGMICQFSPEGDKPTLANIDFKFPIDVYPVGRLDEDSEGLLLLTNDKKVNNLLLDPAYAHKRTYLVQVEGSIDESAVKKLKDGILIRIDKRDHKCLKTETEIIPEPALPARNPPIRFRKSIPTSWIRMSMVEGKNRQVRRMTAATGFPALRLVRSAIEGLDIGKMKVGDVVEVSSKEIYKLLNIKK
jgi:23S rRNA pseudouridine2457 synthase